MDEREIERAFPQSSRLVAHLVLGYLCLQLLISVDGRDGEENLLPLGTVLAHSY